MKESDTAEKDRANPRARIASSNLSLTLVVLALGWVMIYADRLSISPLMNMIRSEFGLSLGATSFVYSVYFAAYVGFTIPATIAAAKFGYKKVMVLFMILAAAALALAGVAGFVFSLLVFFIGLHGVGAGAYYPTTYTISTDLVPKSKRGLASSVINSGMGFGTILGLVVSGPVLFYFSNWQVILLILSVPTILVAILLHRFVPNPNQSSRLASASNSFVANQYKQVLKDRNFIAISGVMFCSLYGYWVILTWAPTFLQDHLHLGISPSGEVTAVFAAVAIPASILISRYSDRVGRKKIALAILPLAALTLFFMAYSSNLIEFLAATIFYGAIGKLTLDPIAIAWILDVVPPNLIGPSLALLNVVAMSSSIFATLATGLIADLTGDLSGGFYLGAAIVLLGALFVAFSKSGPLPTKALG